MTTPRALPLLEEASCLSETPPGDAGFGALETIRGRLPLAALDVHGRIDGLLAQVTMRQVFVNVNHEPLEATYIFPLPDRAAVTGFRMEVAGRVIEGVLQERAQARREYDQALRQGHRATIAEEERPGVFTLRVGNLMPGDRAAVELTMAGALPYLDGEVTFRFPLVVAPRYIPGVPLDGPSVGDGAAVDTDAVPDASRISPPVLLPSFPSPVRLSLAVDLHDSGVPAEDVRVSLHAVCEEPAHDEGMRRIILKPVRGSTATSSCDSGWAARPCGPLSRCIPMLARELTAKGPSRSRSCRLCARKPRPAETPPVHGMWHWCSIARAVWQAGRWWRPAARWPG